MSDAAYTLNDTQGESHLTKLALTRHIDDTAVCNHISLAFACASEALSASEHVIESSDRGYYSVHHAHIWIVLVNESSYMVNCTKLTIHVARSYRLSIREGIHDQCEQRPYE
jgi:hypothetical protein